jgi:DNA-binding CsgD family transcriptional regulator
MTPEIFELNKTDLTDREKECLLWAAEGKTSWETAQILHISERTVIFHLQNATRKLNAANRQNAIARAVVMGLITPQLG